MPPRQLIYSELMRIGRNDLAEAFKGQDEMESVTIGYSRSAPLVQQWVDACRTIKADIKRGDQCQPLQLPPAFPEPVMQQLTEVGLYVPTLTAPVSAEGVLSFERWFTVPLVGRVCGQPSWCQQKESDEMKHVEEVQAVCHFIECNQGSFRDHMRRLKTACPHLVWLVSLRYAGCTQDSRWDLSIRANSFLAKALETDGSLGRPACMLGCLLDAEAMVFDPFKIEVPGGSSTGTSNILCRFLQIVENVDIFMVQAKAFAKEQGKRLHELGLQPRKLAAAGRTFWQISKKFRFNDCAPLDDDTQAQKLINLLAAFYPEQVAVRATEAAEFYAGGLRVRGKSVTAVSGECQQVFMLGPTVQKFTKAADAYQATFKPVAVLPLERSVTDHASELKVVFVSDSSLWSAAFVYGIQLLLRQAGLRLFWICVRGGATAADLLQCWTKAPRCHRGLTIYNGNDIQDTQDLVFEELQEDVRKMVEAAAGKCEKAHFVCNDPKFFPKLDQSEEGFAGLMHRLTAFMAQVCGQEVWMCSDFLGRIKMKDSMHFAQESAEDVAMMYTCDLLRDLGRSSDGVSEPGAPVQPSAGILQRGALLSEKSTEDEAEPLEREESREPAEPCDAETWNEFFHRAKALNRAKNNEEDVFLLGKLSLEPPPSLFHP